MYHQDNVSPKDTIFAECSGFGKSGVKIFRISGVKSLKTLKILNPKILPIPNVAIPTTIYHPKTKLPIDQCVIIYFKSPKSFTGEDIVEIHIHGSIAIVNILYQVFDGLKDLRMALPGEFSKRAFLNCKIDLTEAEGLADLIDSETEIQHQQAIKQFRGGLSKIYDAWREMLIKINAKLESLIDFPEEDIPLNILSESLLLIKKLSEEIDTHIKDSDRGIKLKEGIKLVIIGEPNVGKSSLINYLSNDEIAIISDIPGTTRDILNSHLNIAGYPIILTDTAGIRDSSNDIEKIGIQKSYDHAKKADLKILIVDHNNFKKNIPKIEPLVDKHTIIVFNKIDLGQPAEKELFGKKLYFVSIKNQWGLDQFKDGLISTIKQMVAPKKNSPITRMRYKHKLLKVQNILDNILTQDNDLVLITEDIRIATRLLQEITGTISVEDILEEIFTNFCIGK